MSEAVAPLAGVMAPPSPLAPAKGAALVRVWLLVIAVMVYATILVGGATRLTDSGLSITEWKPLLGAFPPMSEAAWAEAFAKYQSMTAQYHQMNPNMDLGGFKDIYWWEWSHRELGRLIGVIFALPLIFFWATGRTTKKLLPHLLILFALGGLQGLIGWWMVSSGVDTDLVSVAPYRLMTHFSLALLIIAYCFWLWLELGATRRPLPAPASRWANVLIWIVGIQMALGALVAGLDAGRGYTDWPLMSGDFVPKAIFALDPWWKNFFENEATTQFLHRMTAYTLLGVAIAAAIRFRASHWSLFLFFAGLVTAQALLGIVTLINAAPLDMSLTHQAFGTVAVLAATRLVWTSRSTN
jgi:cytochrome c oxidase assembly protein subunit 15